MKPIALFLFCLLTFNVYGNEAYNLFNKGLAAFENKDYNQAAKWYRKSAELGFVGAQYILGSMYKDGEGIPQDYNLAAKWYRKTAEKGDVDGQRELGHMYHNGQGVPQDYSLAAKWYRKSAEQGSSSAQYFLGRMYEDGKGVMSSNIQAYAWFALAAKGSRNGDFIKKRNMMAKALSPSGLEQAQELASKLYDKINNKK